MSKPPLIRRVAVLGAGVMGAQIAAHLANAEIEVLLYELPAKEAPNAASERAVAGLRRIDPAPLAVSARAALIRPCNYEQHLAALGACDLVIEAIAERPDWKADLYRRIAPHLGPHTVLATNTSGLSVGRLAEALPEALRSRYCGVHFFNPPRYMRLVELVAGPRTDAGLLDRLETFLTTTLGKGVVRANDTPNFIGNRIGVFSILAVFHHGERLGLPLDLVDALTGPLIGRPKSATYRTADVVGLDTLAHVVKGSAAVLADDPWARYLTLPAWMDRLIEAGALGQKTGAGVYRKRGKTIEVLDPSGGDYRPAAAEVDPEVLGLLRERDPARRMAGLRACAHPQAQFLWAIHRDVWHYAAYLLATIADSARDIDLAMRWGFGWSQGPLEAWQAAGWRSVAGWIDEDIASGAAMAGVALPAWVAQRDGVHAAEGSWSPARSAAVPRRALPVYARQPYPERLHGEPPNAYGQTLFETPAVRCWHHADEIAVLSFRSKLHVIGDDVLDGIHQALDLAEQQMRGLVVWHPEAPFSAGANLTALAPLFQSGDYARLEQAVTRFQHTALRLRYSAVPVVAAVQGLALGGGCEFMMHCDRTVAALESYIGLVEIGVGLIPAGGGSKERAARAAEAAAGRDPFPWVQAAFEALAKGTVARSAEEARELGFLRPGDPIVFHPGELLHVAQAQVLALDAVGYRPPLPRPVRVCGRTGLANLRAALVNMHEGGFISAHDYRCAERIAEALCGGDVDAGTEVSEEWLLALERRAFVELAAEPLTQARIEHMLKTGKPLRN